MKMILIILVCSSTFLTGQERPSDSELPEPAVLILAHGETKENKLSEILAARRYAAFWNTGDGKYANLALAPDFIDKTLPEGREQGLQGPLQASKAFRAIVPNLKVSIEQMIVSADRVVVHLLFEGHFTGEFNGIKGTGQPIRFTGTDIYQVKNGQIIANWHIEDNLNFLKQIGQFSK